MRHSRHLILIALTACLTPFAADGAEWREAYLQPGPVAELRNAYTPESSTTIVSKDGTLQAFSWILEGSWNTSDSAWSVWGSSVSIKKAPGNGLVTLTLKGSASRTGGGEFGSKGATIDIDLLDKDNNILQAFRFPLPVYCEIPGSPFTLSGTKVANFEKIVKFQRRDSLGHAYSCSGSYVERFCINGVVGNGCKKDEGDFPR